MLLHKRQHLPSKILWVLLREIMARLLDHRHLNILIHLPHHILRLSCMRTASSTKREHRDFAFPVLLHVLDILLGIGIERRVDCERTPQCAGLGVHEGVVVKVCQDDGASVERELVVEVLEVDLLPAGDKRFRQARDGMEDEVELALDC